MHQTSSTTSVDRQCTASDAEANASPMDQVFGKLSIAQPQDAKRHNRKRTLSQDLSNRIDKESYLLDGNSNWSCELILIFPYPNPPLFLSLLNLLSFLVVLLGLRSDVVLSQSCNNSSESSVETPLDRQSSQGCFPKHPSATQKHFWQIQSGLPPIYVQSLNPGGVRNTIYTSNNRCRNASAPVVDRLLLQVSNLSDPSLVSLWLPRSRFLHLRRGHGNRSNATLVPNNRYIICGSIFENAMKPSREMVASSRSSTAAACGCGWAP